MISALSRWWGYYCTGLGLIESKIVLAFWRFAHRRRCNGANANNWEVARRELISTEVTPLSDKIYSRIVLHFPTSAAACSHMPLWEITEWDFRMKCRKCGRIHQRTLTHYHPL